MRRAALRQNEEEALRGRAEELKEIAEGP